MPLPVLATKPLTNSARVSSFLASGEETPRQSDTACLSRDRAATDGLIEQAYRQIYFHAFKVDRDAVLESQLRSGQISTRDFIRALLLSDKFTRDFYRCNSNYRVVEQVVGRVLGRPVHGQAEQIAWSIVIAEQGLPKFVDALLNSDEYRDNFGDNLVPFQRSRVLPAKPWAPCPSTSKPPDTPPTGVRRWPGAHPLEDQTPGQTAAAGPAQPGWKASPRQGSKPYGNTPWQLEASCSPA